MKPVHICSVISEISGGRGNGTFPIFYVQSEELKKSLGTIIVEFYSLVVCVSCGMMFRFVDPVKYPPNFTLFFIVLTFVRG